MMELSFTEDFFYGEGEGPYDLPEPSDRPTSVCQALVSMDEGELRECCEKVGVGYDTEGTIHDLISVIKRTNTCDDASPPVRVYIDSDYDFWVDVYEEQNEDD